MNVCAGVPIAGVLLKCAADLRTGREEAGLREGCGWFFPSLEWNSKGSENMQSRENPSSPSVDPSMPVLESTNTAVSLQSPTRPSGAGFRDSHWGGWIKPCLGT